MDEQVVWVWIEHRDGRIAEVSLELLGEARRIARRLGTKVCALLIGVDIRAQAAGLFQYGAERVYVVSDSSLECYTTEAYLHAFACALEETPASLILIGATFRGKDLAPRLAAHIGAGFASGVIKIVPEDAGLCVTRVECLGKVHSRRLFDQTASLVVTVAPGTIGVERPKRGAVGDVVRLPYVVDSSAIGAQVVGLTKADPKTVGIDEAEMVVAVGNALRDKREVQLAWDLADALGAAVGGSKPVVDKGWLPHSRLIGQSGKRLSARTLIVAGVSGANNFTAGIKDVERIVAINTDRGAPILKVADLSVVGDMREILPELERQTRQQHKEDSNNME